MRHINFTLDRDLSPKEIELSTQVFPFYYSLDLLTIR